MSRKLLFATGEGIGNVIQTIPVIRTLQVFGYSVDFWHAFGSFPIHKKIIPYVENWFYGVEVGRINCNAYDGFVSTFWTRNYVKSISGLGLRLLNKIKPLTMDRSEIDVYMDIARDIGIEDDKIVWTGECLYNRNIKVNKDIDVIIHNGYNPHGAANWSIKSYPYYHVVARKLVDGGYKVASVGSKREYIEGTVDLTGLPLLDTFSFLKECKVFLGNDSGLYHVANALGTTNVVIFTATSIKKNYDARFHRDANIICREDLGCSPCQAERRWVKDCTTWDCRDIDSNVVVDKLIELLGAL